MGLSEPRCAKIPLGMLPALFHRRLTNARVLYQPPTNGRIGNNQWTNAPSRNRMLCNDPVAFAVNLCFRVVH